MKQIAYLDAIVANKLLEEQKNNKRNQELAGKLSGSILGHPLQAQILHMIGVPQKSIEEFVLRKFQRGHHVEAWIMTHLPGLINRQEDVEYRGATGHIDALCDMKEWGMPELGQIPHEVKSITNAAYSQMFGGLSKKLHKKPDAKWSHKLQAGMYAMALNSPAFVIHYVASDDYRIQSLMFETAEIAEDVDRIIDEVITQLATGRLPVFIAREDWQNNPEYNNYPLWMSLGEDEANEKLKKEYPEAYSRLLLYADRLKGGE